MNVEYALDALQLDDDLAFGDQIEPETGVQSETPVANWDWPLPLQGYPPRLEQEVGQMALHSRVVRGLRLEIRCDVL